MLWGQVRIPVPYSGFTKAVLLPPLSPCTATPYGTLWAPHGRHANMPPSTTGLSYPYPRMVGSRYSAGVITVLEKATRATAYSTRNQKWHE